AQDPDREPRRDQGEEEDDDDHSERDFHQLAPSLGCSAASGSGRTTRVSPSTASTRTLSPSRTGPAPAASRAPQRVPRIQICPVGAIAERASALAPIISSVPARTGVSRWATRTLRATKKSAIAASTPKAIRP